MNSRMFKKNRGTWTCRPRIVIITIQHPFTGTSRQPINTAIAKTHMTIHHCWSINSHQLLKEVTLLRVIHTLTHYFDIVSDISSGRIYGIYLHTCTVFTYILTFYTFYLTFFLAYTMTFYLTFFLASILTYCVAYILTAVYLASILTFSWHSICHMF